MPKPHNEIEHRFWFAHSSGRRLYPYRLLNRDTGRATFRVAKPGSGANRKENQIELDDVEDVYRHVFGHGWSVRLRGRDPKFNGLYSPKGHSIVGTGVLTSGDLAISQGGQRLSAL